MRYQYLKMHFLVFCLTICRSACLSGVISEMTVPNFMKFHHQVEDIFQRLIQTTLYFRNFDFLPVCLSVCFSGLIFEMAEPNLMKLSPSGRGLFRDESRLVFNSEIFRVPMQKFKTVEIMDSIRSFADGCIKRVNMCYVKFKASVFLRLLHFQMLPVALVKLF